MLNEDGNVIATLELLSLFIPYAVRKHNTPRPPLMHIASLLNDIPLLKRALDVESRGELWNFQVSSLSFLFYKQLGIEPLDHCICLSLETWL